MLCCQGKGFLLIKTCFGERGNDFYLETDGAKGITIDTLQQKPGKLFQMRRAGEGQKLLNKKTELWLSGGCCWS